MFHTVQYYKLWTLYSSSTISPAYCCILHSEWLNPISNWPSWHLDMWESSPQ